jgi:rod shape-determining protein MreB
MCEPSVVAIDKTTDRVIKVGREAQEMLGRTPDGIVALRPLKDGIVNDYEVTLKMLQYFIRRACGNTANESKERRAHDKPRHEDHVGVRHG